MTDAEPGEPGPVNLGGRPSIGPKGEVRLTEATWARVDSFAAGRQRADALRDLVALGLAAAEAARTTGQGAAWRPGPPPRGRPRP